MNDISIRIDQDENAILAFEASDEAVERAAGELRYGAAAATVAFCSGLDSCPGERA